MRASIFFALAAVAATAACGSDTPSSGGGGTPPAVVASVTVTGGTSLMLKGRTAQLTATARTAEGTTVGGRTVTWSSSAVSVATVSPTGMVTAIAEGQVMIRATIDGVTGERSLEVQPSAVASVVISPNPLALEAGQTAGLQATLKDELGAVLTDRTVQWSSDKPQVAAVNPVTGMVTAVASGTATITATAEGKHSSVAITVTAPEVPVAAITIAPLLDTVEAWDPQVVAATLFDAQGAVLTGRAVQWTSSDPAIATIDPATGALLGKDRGTVTITARSGAAVAAVTRVIVIKYRSMAVGTMHACDLSSGGFAWCWGLNGNEGRLGLAQLGPDVSSTVPVAVPGDHRFVQLVTFGRHSCGLTAAGQAWCWGYNGWGALGSGSNVSQSSVPMPVAGNHVYRALAAGSDHACGIEVGTNAAWCWGNGEWRQLGTGVGGSSSAPVLVSGNAGWSTIAAGASFTCAVTMAHAAYCWGANGIGQVGDGGPISYGNTFVALPTAVAGNLQFTMVTTGSQYACGVTTAQMAYCWGSNNGKLGNGGSTDASQPIAVAGGHQFLSLSSGYGHTCGVTPEHDVYCWGANTYGQIGGAVGANGSTVPVKVGGKAAEVAAAGIGTGSAGHTCAIAEDRLTTYCWGRNDVGQLGNGLTAPAPTWNPAPSIVVGQKPL